MGYAHHKLGIGNSIKLTIENLDALRKACLQPNVRVFLNNFKSTMVGKRDSDECHQDPTGPIRWALDGVIPDDGIASEQEKTAERMRAAKQLVVPTTTAELYHNLYCAMGWSDPADVAAGDASDAGAAGTASAGAVAGAGATAAGAAAAAAAKSESVAKRQHFDDQKVIDPEIAMVEFMIPFSWSAQKIYSQGSVVLWEFENKVNLFQKKLDNAKEAFCKAFPDLQPKLVTWWFFE